MSENAGDDDSRHDGRLPPGGIERHPRQGIC